MKRQALRADIRAMLENSDFDGLRELVRRHPAATRMLISMTYDKADVLSWRAMEAIGKIAADMPVEKARNLIQRLLWMLREESGTNAWSAADIIGEIIRENPGPFEDVVPVVISFHEEDFLRPGSLRAMARIAEARPALVMPFAGIALLYLHSGDPEEKGYALLALKALGMKEHFGEVEKAVGDESLFRFYEGNSLVEMSIGRLAKSAAAALAR